MSENLQSNDCPTQNELIGLLYDSLSPEEQLKCSQHVQTCGDCQREVKTLCEQRKIVLAGSTAADGEPSQESIAAWSNRLAQKLRSQLQGDERPHSAPAPAVDSSNLRTMITANPEPSATENTVVRGGTDSETSVTRQFEEKSCSAATHTEFPETFGRYAIQKVLGQGAMGAVYLARDTQLDRDVALKVPKFGETSNVDYEEMLARFYREARASATLRSPNICPVHDVGEIEGQHYITMAYIEGRPLKDFTKSKKQHSEKQIITTIRKLALGLAEAHEIGVIHRDLKPANIMVDKKGEPVVMDFGLARRSSSDDVQVTQSGAILGTPAYMAPEQVAGDQAAINHQVDIYALGVIMYELITGEMPFRGNLMALLQQIALNNPTKPSELRPDIDPRLETICLKMMAGDQKQRYQSMTDVAADLQEILRNPGKRQKKERAKKTSPKPTSIPSANEESNPALISIEQPKSYAEQLREKKGNPAKNSKQSRKTMPASSKSKSSGPPKNLLIAGGIGGTLLLLGIMFLVRVGKYDVQITLDDPRITLSVDGEVLNITDGQDVYKLSAGKHKLQLQKDGLKTHVEEFTVSKDGKTALRAVVVNDKLDALLNGEKPVSSNPQEEIVEQPKKDTGQQFGLAFDTKDAYVDCGDIPLDITKPLTIELWCHPTAFREFDSIVAAPQKPFAFGPFDLEVIQMPNRPAPTWSYKAKGNAQGFNVVSSFEVLLNQPVHIACQWTGQNGHLELYVNGTKFDDEKSWGNIQGSSYELLKQSLGQSQTEKLRLGSHLGNGDHFRGVIHQLRVSNRKVYDAKFVPQALSNETGTVALYHFDEGTGEILHDSSGHGYHGKIIGAKWVSNNSSESKVGVKASGEKIDVLRSINLAKHTYRDEFYDKWNWDQQYLVSPLGNRGLIQTDIVFPKDYEMTAVVERISGYHKDGMLFGACIDGFPCKVGIDVLRPLQSGMETINGKLISANETQFKGQLLRGNEKHTIRIRVEGHRIQASVDEREFLSWEGDPNQLGYSGPTIEDPRNLWFEVLFDQYQIQELTLRPLTQLPPGAVNPPSPAIAPFNEQQAKAHQQAWADYLGVSVETVNSSGQKMVLIPPGEFMMGSTDEQIEAALKIAKDSKLDWSNIFTVAQYEQPQHKVRLTKPFLMGATEVTVGQFREFVEATKYVTEAEQYGFGNSFAKTINDNVTDEAKKLNWRAPGYEVTDDYPVANVTWNDALAYCQWLSEKEQKTYRLPTEAEWESACRAGSTTLYSCGDDDSSLGQYAWYYANRLNHANSVAKKLPNAYGLFDMSGNVAEWCSDGWDATCYQRSLAEDPFVAHSGGDRMIRGGGWFSPPTDCRSAERTSKPQSLRIGHVGFRIIREIEVSPAANLSSTASDHAPSPAVAPFDEKQARAHQQAWADYLGVPVEKEVELPGGEKMVFMLIPPGEFMMGSGKQEHDEYIAKAEGSEDTWGVESIRTEHPQQRVEITQPFYLGKFEVTQAQWMSVMESNPSKFNKDLQNPVETVSWDDIDQFLVKSNTVTASQPFSFALPTQAQWEFACRAGGTTAWHGTESESDLAKVGWHLANASGQTHPVGQLVPNAFDLHDMHGNVLEWCSDWHSPEHALSEVKLDPMGPTTGKQRIRRGGHIFLEPGRCRAAYKAWFTPDSRQNFGGFRLAMKIDTAKLKESSAVGVQTGDQPTQAWNTPSFLQWVSETQKLPAEQQLEAFSQKMMQLNPGFDGKLRGAENRESPKIENGIVTELGTGLNSDVITDISPVRVFTGLKILWVCPPFGKRSRLTDLSPLAGMKIQYLDCSKSYISDLSPLRDCTELRWLSVSWGRLEDLSDLRDLKLTHLWIHNNERISDLSPLADMPLKMLQINFTSVTDFSSLRRLPLNALHCVNNTLTDISALENCKDLKYLNFSNSAVPAAQLDSLRKTLPECEFVLDGTKLVSAPPPAIAPFGEAQAKAHQQTWAEHLGVPVEYENSIGMKFVLIPPGEFEMGSSAQEYQFAMSFIGEEDTEFGVRAKSETPKHKVKLTQPYYLGVHEVTLGQYERVMGEQPAYFSVNGEGKAIVAGIETTNFPVEMVSWNDAAEFCSKLSEEEKLQPAYQRQRETVAKLQGNGYHLPSEAQWEFACRAGSTSMYWMSDESRDLNGIGWTIANSQNRTHAVGELEANPFGLYDVHGNVWEWVQDHWTLDSYEPFVNSNATDPDGAESDDDLYVTRGGSWNFLNSYCRSASRHGVASFHKFNNTGIRVALPVGTVKQLVSNQLAPPSTN